MIGARVSILQIYSLRVYQYKLVKQLDMQNVTYNKSIERSKSVLM